MKTKAAFLIVFLFAITAAIFGNDANAQNPANRPGYSVAATSKAQFRSNVALDGPQVLIPTADVVVGTGNTYNAGASASVQFADTAKCILLPRLTSTQITALDSLVPGLLLYRTTDSSLRFYNGAAWKEVSTE